MNNNQITSSAEEPPQTEEKIIIENKDVSRYVLTDATVLKVAKYILDYYKLGSYELNINFVSSDEIKELNHHYRLKDKPTDVLSFPQTEFYEPISANSPPKHSEVHNILGDLVICIDIAEKNANSIGHDIDRELAFLMIHGILHLGGHDHKSPSDEKIMIAEQKSLISLMSKDEKNHLYKNMVSKKSNDSVSKGELS